MRSGALLAIPLLIKNGFRWLPAHGFGGLSAKGSFCPGRIVEHAGQVADPAPFERNDDNGTLKFAVHGCSLRQALECGKRFRRPC